MKYNEIRDKIILKAIKTKDLDKIIKVAEHFNDKRLLDVLRSFKYSKASTKQLQALNMVIIKGETL